MSTDRNEKISNHEKGMFRDSFPSGEWVQTHSVSGVENVIISASLWCGHLCWEWRHVSGHKDKYSSALERKVWNEMWCLLLLGVACVTLNPPLKDCWTCKEGAASLSKLNIFRYLSLSGIFHFQTPFAKRKLWGSWPGITQVSLGAHPDPCLYVGGGSISCMFWSLNQGWVISVLLLLWLPRSTLPACPGALLQAHVAVSLSVPDGTVQNPASEPLSPRKNCFNLIKWRWNLKWLNVYLLTGRNVL